jgi:hypothetical protein
MKTLKYYSDDGTLTEFNKYTIDEYGVVRNRKSGKALVYRKTKKGYNNVTVMNDSGKRCCILVGRALASTFIGQPTTPKHTADHRDRNPQNDTLDNIRWLCKKGQRDNQDRPETMKTAFIIVKDDLEKTVNEWVDYLIDEKNPFGREYTNAIIIKYAQRKQCGFSYKEYPDLPDEIWKEIKWSKTAKGLWKISNMNRVKYITKCAENVLSGERLRVDDGYPMINFDGKHWKCHILAFMTFYPAEYANKKPNEFILHEDDDKLDFRPHKLRVGTRSDNTKDAHDNGKYDDKQKARQKCMSYIDGVLEKEHDSQHDAVKYLKSLGYDKASQGNISLVLSGERPTAHDRTWKY